MKFIFYAILLFSSLGGSENFLNKKFSDEHLHKTIRFKNAVHEAGHILLFTPILKVDRPYTKKILRSINAHSNNMKEYKKYDVLACVTSYETNTKLSREEIMLRMKMFLAGEIAYKYKTGIQQKEYLKVNSIPQSDMYKWYRYAKEDLNLSIAECKALKKKQEKEVESYIANNMDKFNALVGCFYKQGFLSNNQILNIIYKP